MCFSLQPISAAVADSKTTVFHWDTVLGTLGPPYRCEHGEWSHETSTCSRSCAAADDDWRSDESHPSALPWGGWRLWREFSREERAGEEFEPVVGLEWGSLEPSQTTQGRHLEMEGG